MTQHLALDKHVLLLEFYQYTCKFYLHNYEH